MRSAKDPSILFVGTRPILIVWSLILLIGAIAFDYYSSSEASLRYTVDRIEQGVQKAQGNLRNELVTLLDYGDEELFEHFEQSKSSYEELGSSYFVFHQDSLVAWSSSSVPQVDLLPDLYRSGPCILLANGWYLMERREAGDRVFFGLFLMKYEYLYENRYLVNEFHPYFQVEHHPEVTFAADQRSEPVLDLEDHVLFYLSLDEDSLHQETSGIWILASILLCLFFLVRTLFDRLFQRDARLSSFFLGALGIVVFRMLTLVWNPLELLGDLSLFQAFTLGHSYLHPDPGALVINAFLLLLLCYVFRKWTDRIAWKGQWTVFHVLLVGYFIGARGLDVLYKELILRTDINFDISNFFDLDLFSIVGLLGIGSYLIAALFLAQALTDFLLRTIDSSKKLWVIYLTMGSGLIAINHYYGVVDLIKVLWPWMILTYFMLMHRVRLRGPRLVYVLGAMALLSLYASHMLEKHIIKNDREQLAIVAERLMEGEDEVAELLFDDMRDRLEGDSLIWQLATKTPFNEERLLIQFRQDYFNGYWTKYDLAFDRVSPAELGQSGFRDLPDSVDMGFSRISQEELGLNYVFFKRLDANKVVLGLFELNIIPEDLGFPELLIEGDPTSGKDMAQYSFAQYHERELVDSYGDFDYRLEWSQDMDDGSRYYQEQGYWHFPFDRGQDTYIISTPRKSFIDRLTTFTYLFCFLGLMIGLAYFIERILIEQRWPRADLQYKVQFLVISILFTSLFVFGLGAYYYILSQHTANNEKILSEKVSSVLIELSHKLEKEQAIGDREKLEVYLDKFAKVFFTDINLYQLDGELMASSRPQVFNRGLISEQMDPGAYKALRFDAESKYIHEERIGGLNYLSAYVPFMDSEKNVLAYLNLPYFAKQKELEDDLSRFVVTVINVLVLLFVMSILVAVLISNWVTRPLQMLKDNLAAIRLDQTNKPIEYSGTDEIASLVEEYNAKVEELQANAELLAKSERESAWREMAKQVAHEIKNPLTPMKLSIQYLQRSLQDRGEDWEQRFERSTDMLIEQIDTLSAIATAFSDFAQMPKAQNERFAIGVLVDQVVDLFSEEPKVELFLENQVDAHAEIIADKDQITRLLTNLIKNAIQSIPDEEEGKVVVDLQSKGHQYILEVRDNGTGIPEDMHEKIFVPNFTTKSTGTGLGLAMSKNIVEQAGGRIWFKSKEGVGTSFFVSLPMPPDS
ncbi:MAG: GHKL domain-containing protein [Flavobacteriales bacterium]|nr:GHKL domain-containing protein [Flavobacteriales bacterium]